MAKAEVFAVGEESEARWVAFFAQYGVYILMLQAWVATLGSLYLSEVMGFIPCELCWWQRIFMYPIALVATWGVFRSDDDLPNYALLLAVPGIAFSTYHYLLQVTPFFGDGSSCAVGTGVSCKSDYIAPLFPAWTNNMITIPLLAWIAFAVIIGAALLTKAAWRREAAH
jgi:disulfide bond formation protein DsbB